MENVNTILSVGSTHITESMSVLRGHGYGITGMVLNAADFGVPQNRKRFFLVARLGGTDCEMLGPIKRQKAGRHTSVREYCPHICRGMQEQSTTTGTPAALPGARYSVSMSQAPPYAG